MNSTDALKKLKAATDLCKEPVTTIGAMRSVSTLVRGANRDVDRALDRFEQVLSTWEKVENGEVVELAADRLPENTEEEKKRKRALLLLISSWKSLGSEIERVQHELAQSGNGSGAAHAASVWGKVFAVVKGPFGIITIAAVVAVVTLQQVGVTLVIENESCPTLYASGSMPFSLPGLSLPKDPIASGEEGVAIVPPLSVTVDGTSSTVLSLTALTFSTTFALPSSIEKVELNGESLLGIKKDISLLAQKEHRLLLQCN